MNGYISIQPLRAAEEQVSEMSLQRYQIGRTDSPIRLTRAGIYTLVKEGFPLCMSKPVGNRVRKRERDDI